MIAKKILLISDNCYHISNFIDKHLEKYKDDKLVVYSNFVLHEQSKNVTFICGDLHNEQLISYIINQYKINTVINCMPTNALAHNVLYSLNEDIHYVQLSSINIYEPKFLDDSFENSKNIINEKIQDASLIDLIYCDLFTTNYCTKNNIKHTIIRCCNSFGKYQDKFLKKIVDGLNSYNCFEMSKEDCLYDWVSYKSLYEAIDLILNKKVYGTIDVSSGILLSNVDFAGLVCTAYRQIKGKNDSKIKLIGNKTSASSFKYGANSSMIKELGWNVPIKNSVYTDILSIISFYI